jgi:hypothetical protein
MTTQRDACCRASSMPLAVDVGLMWLLFCSQFSSSVAALRAVWLSSTSTSSGSEGAGAGQLDPELSAWHFV